MDDEIIDDDSDEYDHDKEGEEVLGVYLDKDNSDFVGEGDKSFGTKRYLYTTGVDSCVIIYAISGDFIYLGHINVRDIREEFVNNRTEKISILFEKLAEIKEKIDDTIFVGLVYGVEMDYFQRDKYGIIVDDLETGTDELRKLGLDIEIQDPLTSESLVIDREKRTLIYDEERINFSVDKEKEIS